VVIANGENAAHGAGITGALAKSIFDMGVDVITLGDHVWDQKGWESEISGFEKLCRPANLPTACPGKDHVIVDIKGFKLAVFTVLGRQYLELKSACPFATADGLMRRLDGKADGFFVEVHAEATSEKQAMGWYLDGRAVAVVGTHTHVATADAQVLPNGTAYLTDAGMTGPHASVLGRDVRAVIDRFLDGMPRRCEVAEGDNRISGVLVTYDTDARRATRVELVSVRGG
jgi:2',3'-cyclic-nucleotide 2'-phosphodiesterase